MPQRDLTYREWREEHSAKHRNWQHRDRVQTAIDAGVSARTSQPTDVPALRAACRVLIHRLLGGDGRLLAHYSRALNGSFPYTSIQAVIAGDAAPEQVALAFEGLVEIADFENLVDDKSNHATAMGFALQLGRVWASYDMEYGNQVKLVTRDSGWPKTLFVGKTGQGKSATLDAEVADRYAAGMKVIDLVDTDEFENAVYDIPQQQRVLREKRAELGLARDTEQAADIDTPDLEVLVPLTDDTAGMDIPVPEGGDVEDSVVRPFTIPTSSFDQTTLVNFLTALVSQQQEASIRTAYDKVSTGRWTLRDLAEQVASRDDLQESYQRRVLRLLENLQDKGFIRDADCEHAIDWDHIFDDPDTITAFSVAPLEESVDQLMVLSYLLRALYDERKSRSELPPCVGVARELHEIVPHRNETAADARAEALQEAIASNLSYILRKNRHERLEILADTQDLMDLKKGVRNRFSRFVAFKMPDTALESCFSYAGASDWQSCRDSIGPEAGVGAVIGMTEAAINYERDFISPVEFAPAPFHHFDVDEHASGFDTRADYRDEELVPAPWLADVPEDLVFTVAEIADDEETVTDEGERFRAFAEECLVVEEGATLPKQPTFEAFNNFATERGFERETAPNWFSRRFNEHVHHMSLEGLPGEPYRDVALTETGRTYAPDDATPSHGTASSD